MVMLVTPWALGGLHPTREDLAWAILLSFAAGFLSIGAVVISAFDIARLDAGSPAADDGPRPSTSGPSGLPQWRECVVVAYLDEPPFAIPSPPPSRPTGCDMDLADHVLTAVGPTTIRYVPTTFPELIPGLIDGRWHMTTGIFITDDRAEVIDYIRPIWAAPDGFIVRRADAARLTSYEAIAASGATLAVVSNQVQSQTARSADIPQERIIEFPDQDAAAAAVRDGRVDASASTAIGNKAYVQRANEPALTTVTDQPTGPRSSLALGAFAVGKNTPDLTAAINDVLDRYIGSPDHLALAHRYGFSKDDLRPILRPRPRRPTS
jgi:polar amino acid transport system substrate-binding protein